MGRYALVVLMLTAFVVLAGCGSGPGVNEMSGGGFAAASENGEFVPADEPGDLVLDEPFDPQAALELPLPEVAAAASPLKLWLTGGRALKHDTGTGRDYYPMKMGESRPICCTWSGGTVTNLPVWTAPLDPYARVGINAMHQPPRTLNRNFLYPKDGGELWNQVRVRYGGRTQSVWVKVDGLWPRPGQTAPLNPAGARLKIVGSASAWSTGTQHGARYFWTTQSGILTLRARMVGSYANSPTPMWTADQAKLKFVGSSTGRTVQFRIRQRGEWYPLTAKVGVFSVTVLVKGQ
ncbi:MAG: hypothetical protein OEV37_01050 [Candidatus Berkelbacteria bacterium]|nr:hypothetical protein [Candidatus Berkelbacteria bacterium]